MSDFQFGNVAMLHGLWLLPALAALMVYASRRRREALRRFVEDALLARIPASSRPDRARRVLKGTLLLAALGLLVVALARPAWDAVTRDVVQRGRDVVFLLDVSRSMLAEDLPPNRLERAKLAVLDAVDRLEGDRVALAVFAGATVVKCPLTLDYGFFRMALDDASPLSVARGGSLIGDGLRTVLRDVFDSKRSNYRDVVLILITDGEGSRELPARGGAAEAGEFGVRLIAIGLGDERVGQRIPVGLRSGYRRRRSEEFPAARGPGGLVEARCRDIATDGVATPGGPLPQRRHGVHRLRLGVPASRRSGRGSRDRRADDGLAAREISDLLAICLLLLVLEMVLPERVNARRAAVFTVVAALAPGLLQAASVRWPGERGQRALPSGSLRGGAGVVRRSSGARSRVPAGIAQPRERSLQEREVLRGRRGLFAGGSAQLGREICRTLEAAGLHSLGNALYRQAEAAAATDPRRALELLAPARPLLSGRAPGRTRGGPIRPITWNCAPSDQQLREQASQQGSGGSGGSGRPRPAAGQPGLRRSRAPSCRRAGAARGGERGSGTRPRAANGFRLAGAAGPAGSRIWPSASGISANGPSSSARARTLRRASASRGAGSSAGGRAGVGRWSPVGRGALPEGCGPGIAGRRRRCTPRASFVSESTSGRALRTAASYDDGRDPGEGATGSARAPARSGGRGCGREGLVDEPAQGCVALAAGLVALPWAAAQDEPLRARAAIQSQRVYVGQQFLLQIQVEGTDQPTG